MTRDYNPEIDDANQQAQDHGAPFVPSVPSYLLLSHEVEKLKEILSRARTVICDLLEVSAHYEDFDDNGLGSIEESAHAVLETIAGHLEATDEETSDGESSALGLS
jgi:hypothetical protein